MGADAIGTTNPQEDSEHKTSTETTSLLRFVTETSETQLPQEVLHESKRCLLDFFALAIGAVEEPAVSITRQQILKLGGAPQASSLGSSVMLRVTDAALVNGIAAHAFDYDDTHIPTILHPTSPLYAAGLAVAQWKRLSGRSLLAAHALGYELAARVSVALYPEHYDVGWHMTGTTGCLASYGASARLLGLKGTKALHGLSLATTQASGHREQFGTMTKPFHAGHAASAGLLAALLCGDGFTAAPDPLQGRRGMFAVMSSAHTTNDLVEHLGERWEIFANGAKPYACGVVIHPAADAMRHLRARVDVADIEEIHMRVHPLVLELTGKNQPRTSLEGKFSVTFVCAMALLEGRAGEREFTDENVRRPEVVELMHRIKLVADATMHHSEAAATALTHDGRSFESHVENARGTPKNPLSDEDLRSKFHELVDPVLGATRAQELERLIWAVDEVSDVSEMVRCASPL